MVDEMIYNPGSEEAVNQGCTCPVLDNGHGDEILGHVRGFWIDENCPLHAVQEEETDV